MNVENGEEFDLFFLPPLHPPITKKNTITIKTVPSFPKITGQSTNFYHHTDRFGCTKLTCGSAHPISNDKKYTEKHDVIFKPYPNRFGKKVVCKNGEVYTVRDPYYKYADYYPK